MRRTTERLPRHGRSGNVATVAADFQLPAGHPPAREAVRLSERSVVTEQEKFRLGLATLFDAILAEDSLTNARLRRTNAQYRFSAALARFRFESGTLLQTAADAVTADASSMTTFAFEERKR